MSSQNKILVVEDNDFVRMQMVRYLQDADFEVVEANSGDTALELTDESIDLAIVDVRMEPIDGFEYLRSVRGQDLQTLVILVTGDQNPDLLSEAQKLGVKAVLMKPLQKDRLVKMVNRAIEMRNRSH